MSPEQPTGGQPAAERIRAAGGVALPAEATFPGASAVLSNYVPTIDHPLFQAGQVAFALGVGEYGLAETPSGYHVIKVTDKKAEGVATLEEATPQLTEMLRSQKEQAELEKLIQQLREGAKIEILISGRQTRD